MLFLAAVSVAVQTGMFSGELVSDIPEVNKYSQ
jgi:hypothetical protein